MSDNTRAGLWMVGALATYGSLVMVVVLILVVREWPDTLPIAPDANPEMRYLLLVAICGALGGCIRMLMSLFAFLVNRQLKHSWFIWYIIEPLVGMIFAMLIYFTIRGGLVLGVDSLNPIGILAISVFAGLFGRQGIKKLNEVAYSLFKENDVQQRTPADAKKRRG